MIEHSALLDFSVSFRDYFDFNEATAILQQTSISFDVHVEEIFPVLLSGGRVVLLPGQSSDIDGMISTINSHQVDVMFATPLVVGELNERATELPALKTIISGGDVLKDNHIDRLRQEKAIYNGYGPTECTVGMTFREVKASEDASNIGKPFPNRRVYILDANEQLLPVGVPGELCISGEGLARGYVNSPSLTAEKFVPNPHEKGQPMYKTGDLCRWLGDGTIEFLGRIDDQFKIRGYRIEPTEVEEALRDVPGIDNTLVLAKDGGESKVLYAYYSGRQYESEDLRRRLQDELPHYMVPSYLVYQETFPLTSNGKIDRRKLLSIEVAEAPFAAPETGLQKALAAIWEEILDRTAVGLNDNFFELGGQSLKALRVINKVHQSLGKDLKLMQLYNHPTIEEIATLIEQDSQHDDLLMYFNRSGKQAVPLFMIPPVLGTPMGFQHLADSLGDAAQCVGVLQPGLFNDREEVYSIKALAAQMAEEILTVQKEGTFNIMGYSMGAWTAFEITRLLEARGHTVNLMLVDRSANADIEEERRETLERQFEYHIGQLKSLDHVAMKALKNVFIKNSQMMADYEVDGEIHANITALQGTVTHESDAMDSWAAVTTGSFNITHLPFGHLEMIHQKELADCILQSLRAPKADD